MSLLAVMPKRIVYFTAGHFWITNDTNGRMTRIGGSQISKTLVAALK